MHMHTREYEYRVICLVTGFCLLSCFFQIKWYLLSLKQSNTVLFITAERVCRCFVATRCEHKTLYILCLMVHTSYA